MHGRFALGFWIILALAISAPAADEEKAVIPFDFLSRFDDGTLGRQVAEMVWAKINRQKNFIVPESLGDVRDFCKSKGLVVGPATDTAKVKKIVTEDFSAHIGVWGSVERAAGFDAEVYDLVIKCYDFSADPPKSIYEVTARTNSAAEIPHLYVKQLIDALYQRKPGPTGTGRDPVAEENWAKNPNLIVGGDFERGSGGVPYGWESRGGQEREPLGNLVKWLDEAGAAKPNKVIRLSMDKGLGDSSGVMYYSKAFPMEEGATYRLQCRWRSSGPAAKIFVKVYGDMFETSHYQPTPEIEGAREVYRSQQNLKGPKNQWNFHTEDFTPRHTKYDLKYGKLDLYGYLGAGTVEFDDFVLKQIVPASPHDQKKVRKHSLATKVTLKEMEENERRSRTATESEQSQSFEPKKKPRK